MQARPHPRGLKPPPWFQQKFTNLNLKRSTPRGLKAAPWFSKVHKPTGSTEHRVPLNPRAPLNLKRERKLALFKKLEETLVYYTASLAHAPLHLGVVTALSVLEFEHDLVFNEVVNNAKVGRLCQCKLDPGA